MIKPPRMNHAGQCENQIQLKLVLKQKKMSRLTTVIPKHCYILVKISPASCCQMSSLTHFEWKYVSNVILQDFSDGALFLFECVPLIGPLVRVYCCSCCCGESQCFSAIRERQQLNANRPIEDGGNYCLAFLLERYRLACHTQLSSARVCV